eukprot:TRINITY_DN8519_c0_g1_i1.p1 TRINITY_DN8519_c0_g1~~TRINITY_DN8519_c0_g1_i1.p1  ORF type:complete len:429 (+),score=53.42 TRINITY_DN8519_c0_g1_i1:98-1384(+)
MPRPCTDHPASLPELTIRNMAGDVLLGPELLGDMISIDQLKDRVRPLFPPPGLSVSLLLHGVELQNLEDVLTTTADDSLELTAVFPREELSDRERETLLEKFERDLPGSFFCGLKTIARADKDLVLRVIQRSGQRISHRSAWSFQELRHVHKSLQADYDVVLAAVTVNGLQLEHAFPSLQSNRDIVLAAVRQNPHALSFAAWAFWDCEIIRAAVEARRPLGRSGWTAWNFTRLSTLLEVVPDVVRSDVGVMKAAALRDGRLFWYAQGAARKDRKVIRAATKSWLRGQLWDLWDMPEEVAAELGYDGTSSCWWCNSKISSTDVRTLPWKSIAHKMKTDERAQVMRDRLCNHAAEAVVELAADALAAEEERWIATSGAVVAPRCRLRFNHLAPPRSCAKREGQRKSKRMRRWASHRNSFAGTDADHFNYF